MRDPNDFSNPEYPEKVLKALGGVAVSDLVFYSVIIIGLVVAIAAAIWWAAQGRGKLDV